MRHNMFEPGDLISDYPKFTDSCLYTVVRLELECNNELVYIARPACVPEDEDVLEDYCIAEARLPVEGYPGNIFCEECRESWDYLELKIQSQQRSENRERR